MALDKAIDSARLDADLSSVADAIRAKSGGRRDLSFPEGFVSELGTIETSQPEPVYGLITEQTVTERTAVLTFPLPPLVVEDGRLWVELIDLAHDSDYLYVQINNLASSVGNTYFPATTTENRRFPVLFIPNREFAGVNYPGGYAVLGASRQGVSRAAYSPEALVLKLYSSSSHFTGGTVRLYGRTV